MHLSSWLVFLCLIMIFPTRKTLAICDLEDLASFSDLSAELIPREAEKEVRRFMRMMKVKLDGLAQSYKPQPVKPLDIHNLLIELDSRREKFWSRSTFKRRLYYARKH